MIIANNGSLEIKGMNIELFTELDEIFKYAIKEHPEIMQVSIKNRGDDLLNAEVKEEIVVVLDAILKEIIEHEKKDGDIDD